MHERAAELGDAAAALDRSLTTAFLMCRSVVPVMGAGLVGLSRALALEVVRCGITVNIVAAGYISTGSQLPYEAEAAAAGGLYQPLLLLAEVGKDLSETVNK